MSRSPGVGPCDHAHGTPSTPSRIRRYRANPASRLPSPATGRPSPSRRRARRDVPADCSKATGSAFHQPRPHRIPFHVPCRCQQVRLVHHQGSKPPLPQIAAPLLSKLNPPPVASMAFADRPSQRLLAGRNREPMPMVRHEAIAPNIDSFFPTPLGHQFQVRRVLSIMEERLPPTLPPLGHMAWHPRNDHSCQSPQAPSLSKTLAERQQLVLCPQIPSQIPVPRFQIQYCVPRFSVPKFRFPAARP